MDQLDRVFGREEQGPSYARYGNPTREALEELVNDSKAGHGALACSSGMAAMHLAMLAALVDRPQAGGRGQRALRRDHQHADEGLRRRWASRPRSSDVCDLAAFEAAITETKPGAW